MSPLSPGARPLPLRHLSIRVPWHDTDWTGRICQNPVDNISCLVLARIREDKDDQQEAALGGKSWDELQPRQLPPCVSERAGFMAPVERVNFRTHPYSEGSSPVHKRFAPTPFRHPPYAAACIPFAWMLKEEALKKVEALELGFDPDLETEGHAAMGFETEWIQRKQNQLIMLDTFFSAIKPEDSLAIFYAKQTPLVDDPRRVIIGVGRVKHVGDAVDYHYKEPGWYESVLWERAVQHSIRPDFSDGFLLPYHDVLQYLQHHPDDDPRQFMAFAPDEHFWSFSFTSEHVTNDGAIAALLSCARAMENISRVVPGNWGSVQQWIDARLNELWKMRGPYPGLGAALSAFGIPKGTLLAFELEQRVFAEGTADPWPFIDQMLREPQRHPEIAGEHISPTLSKKWNALPQERRALMQLLSRFELSIEQATRYYVHEDQQRNDLDINISDAEILENPYRLYELDRGAPDPIELGIVDRGLFPDDTIREHYPLPAPSAVVDATDERRVRAFVVRELEKAAEEGHTLSSRKHVVRAIRNLDVQLACPVDGDLMAVVEPFFGTVLHQTALANGEPAYQLKHLRAVGQVIRTTTHKRLRGRRHQANIGWRQRLDHEFGGPVAPGDEEEEWARAEKTAALEELFASRLSVLVGPAGTGKTTLLKVLCNEPMVAEAGVLLLAPTGKARVRLEDQTGHKGGQTIAQFLLPLDRYVPLTGQYRLSTNPPWSGARTVIIDEASMLTEEQLAATLDALSGVHRLILVGDPRQLPPIGAGRPFLDIVNELRPEQIETHFPRVSPGYAELTVRRRQVGKERDDLLLADWFSGRPLDPGADEIWSKIETTGLSRQVRFIRWDNDDQLRNELLSMLVDDLGMKDVDDVEEFEKSLGGTKWRDHVYFNVGRDGEGGACTKIDDWQILSPVRGLPHGVEALNRLIQNTFRAATKQRARGRWRRTPKPMGREEIVYGDKVINVRNHRRSKVWPKNGAMQYVANGEIGIVVGQFKGKSAKYKRLPWQLQVEFTSQPGFAYAYTARDFSEESESFLELAYALTVHKVQGSEFGAIFLVLPNPCRLLSRELIYTALTRQQKHVVILHQGPRHELKKFADEIYSESARRLTNLFQAPRPVEMQERLLEASLIHRTRRGDAVRSKSEVVVADLLYSKGVDYQYEAKLIGNDGSVRYPDFTFEDDDMGITYYWEHLGLLNSLSYRERWERKLAWYHQQGILPVEQGGGPAGTLITTRDDEHGGIRSDEIERIFNEVRIA